MTACLNAATIAGLRQPKHGVHSTGILAREGRFIPVLFGIGIGLGIGLGSAGLATSVKNAAQGHVNEAAIMSKGTNDQCAKMEFLEKQASLQVPAIETPVILRQKCL